jgi:hypothetical protein
MCVYSSCVYRSFSENAYFGTMKWKRKELELRFCEHAVEHQSKKFLGEEIGYCKFETELAALDDKYTEYHVRN